ncbi:hypothetical protein KM043_004200 [Ampulex compressa]|nr:hypothetical protein KM043_004200 [Ampulex compressa]
MSDREPLAVSSVPKLSRNSVCSVRPFDDQPRAVERPRPFAEIEFRSKRLQRKPSIEARSRFVRNIFVDLPSRASTGRRRGKRLRSSEGSDRRARLDLPVRTARREWGLPEVHACVCPVRQFNVQLSVEKVFIAQKTSEDRVWKR